jgi:probable F420-dependent oxidoreductase
MATLAANGHFTGVGAGDAVAIARDIKDWGYGAVWGAEVAEQECFALLGAIASHTDLEIGLAVTPVQTRSAFVLARAALTVQELAAGGFRLGIGASSEVLVSRFAGEPYTKPLTYVRETVEAIRPILEGERSTFHGEFIDIGGYKYPLPVDPVPIYLGSLNPASLRLCGEIGDGLCINQFAPEHVPTMLAEVRAGAEAAGRELPDDFPVVARLFCAITDDVAGVKGLLRQVFAPYAATQGYNRFFRWLGYVEEADAIAAAAAAGDKDAMVAAYSDRMLDELFVVGDADAVTERIHEYVDAGVTVPVIAPLAPGTEPARQTLETIGQRFGR